MRPCDDDDLREPCGLTYEQLGRLSDERVMAHLRNNHGDAIAVLLDRYSRLVLSIASKIVHDTWEAEEVVQEVFVDVCRTAVHFDATKGTTKMWIIRTAYRRSLNRRRQLINHQFYSAPGLAEVLNASAADDHSVMPALTMHESRRLVQQMLNSISGVQRRVLEMVFFEGLSLRDVAERTGETLESVRHRYYRGMRRMREVLGRTSGEEKLAAAQERVDANT